MLPSENMANLAFCPYLSGGVLPYIVTGDRGHLENRFGCNIPYRCGILIIAERGTDETSVFAENLEWHHGLDVCSSLQHML